MNFIKRRVNSSGFTLIELLVVIAIIGVLASIVLASLNSARRKSRDARRITDLKQIQLALELYFDASVGGSSNYPVSTVSCDATANARGLEALQTSGYIPQVPRDPSSTTNCYLYASGEINSVRTTYHLGATLEDTANPALNGDKDCDSTDNIPVCTTGATYTNGFDGQTSAAIYDLVP